MEDKAAVIIIIFLILDAFSLRFTFFGVRFSCALFLCRYCFLHHFQYRYFAYKYILLQAYIHTELSCKILLYSSHCCCCVCIRLCWFHCSRFIFVSVTAALFTIRFIVAVWECVLCKRCGRPNHETSQPAKFICRISFCTLCHHIISEREWKGRTTHMNTVGGL